MHEAYKIPNSIHTEIHKQTHHSKNVENQKTRRNYLKHQERNDSLLTKVRLTTDFSLETMEARYSDITYSKCSKEKTLDKVESYIP